MIQYCMKRKHDNAEEVYMHVHVYIYIYVIYVYVLAAVRVIYKRSKMINT